MMMSPSGNVHAMFYIGLQMTDVQLDARVSALEENGGGNPENGKVLHCLASELLKLFC